MTKNSLLFSFLFLAHLQAFAQITFTNQTSALLADTTVYSGCAMGVADMNGDSLDDIIRLSNARILSIEYQQADSSTFDQYFYGTVGSGSQWSMCLADVDENGYNDILIGGAYNQLKLLTANATGDAYTVTYLPTPSIFLQGSNFADIDNNGTIDIFACHDDGISAPFSNDGNGNFTHDISLINAVSTVPSDNSGNYGSVWTDYDNDGDLDMYLSKCRLGVSNNMDGRRINMLFQNDGNNNFTDVAQAAGLRPLAQSWATDFADIDNDGDMDCFMINHDMLSQLYVNNGDGTFTDITTASGMTSSLASLGAGIQCIFDDFDNDAFVDLFVTGQSGQHRLFKNDGDLTFTTVSNPFPTNGLGIQSAVVGDLNNDGYLDVYAGFATGYNNANNTRPDKLFINEEMGANYLTLQLKGTATNSNAIGARVEIYGDWGVQVREVRSGESYGIMTSFSLHFGLAAATEVDSLKIRWPNGEVEKLCGIAPNQFLVLTEANLPELLASDFVLIENGLEVELSNTSQGIADTLEWDFGDGTSSTEAAPTHTFADEGPYTISLTISNDCETSTNTSVWEANALPVELLAFSAEKEGRNTVIQWRAQELNFDYYELERSNDLRTMTSLTTIQGKNKTSPTTYKWLDTKPNIGANYYRLKQVDIDGTFSYSDWKLVNFSAAISTIKVYPNPAKDKLVVETDLAGEVSVTVFTLAGQPIYTNNHLSSLIELDIAAWERGVYFLEVNREGEVDFVRVVKL